VNASVVDIALVTLRVSSSAAIRAHDLLDDRERAAAATREGENRCRYVVAHASARLMLGEHLGVDPAVVMIASEPGGRPMVEGVGFSLAHSDERAAVAIADRGVNLGVDLERVRHRVHLERLARRIFDPDELDAWSALAAGDRPRAFAARWTEIEAVLKARGTGIAGGLASARELGSGWSCVPFDSGTGYVGAVAADVAPIEVTTRVVDFEAALSGRGGTAH
jgi:4'-phosphopantetheinyl transferase